jgi:hypothetical protein
VVHDGEVFGAMADQDAGSILTEDDIEGPVEDMLNLPVGVRSTLRDTQKRYSNNFVHLL